MVSSAVVCSLQPLGVCRRHAALLVAPALSYRPPMRCQTTSATAATSQPPVFGRIRDMAPSEVTFETSEVVQKAQKPVAPPVQTLGPAAFGTDGLNFFNAAKPPLNHSPAKRIFDRFNECQAAGYGAEQKFNYLAHSVSFLEKRGLFARKHVKRDELALEAALTALSLCAAPTSEKQCQCLHLLSKEARPITEVNMRAFCCFADTISRRVRHLHQSTQYEKRAETLAKLKLQADPWRRDTSHVEPKAKDPSEKVHHWTPSRLLADIVSIHQEGTKIGPIFDLITTDNVLQACYYERDLDFAGEILAFQAEIGISPNPKMLWRTFRVARAAGNDEAMADIWQRFVSRSWKRERKQAQWLRHEYIGKLVEEGQLDDIGDLVYSALKVGDDEESRRLFRDVWVPPVPRDPSSPISRHLLPSLQIFGENDRAQRHLVETMDEWVEPVMQALAPYPERLAELHAIAIFHFTHAVPSLQLTRSLELAIDAALAHAHHQSLRDNSVICSRVEAAVNIFGQYATRHGMSIKKPLLARLIDAMALVGQHSVAIRLVRAYVEDAEAAAAQRFDTHPKSPLKHLRRGTATDLVQAALGLHVEDARPGLSDVIDGVSILFSLQSGREEALELPSAMREALTSTLQRSHPGEASRVLDAGSNERIVRLVAEAVDWPRPLPALRLASRARGMTIPRKDPLRAGNLQSFYDRAKDEEAAAPPPDPVVDKIADFFRDLAARKAALPRSKVGKSGPRQALTVREKAVNRWAPVVGS